MGDRRILAAAEESLDRNLAGLRDAVHPIEGADAVVGGAVATELDARSGNEFDLALIAPLVLGVSFIVLLILLRSLVAPLLLLIVNVASAVAAIGAAVRLTELVLDQHALDPGADPVVPVPRGARHRLPIFLVHNPRPPRRHACGHRRGGGCAHRRRDRASTSIVLAAIAALGVLPLVTLGQLGLIVGVGVLVDTLVVRTVIVPAIFTLGGDRIWWPTKPQQVADH